MKFIKENIIAIISITFLVMYTIIGMLQYYKSYNRNEILEIYNRCFSDAEFYESRREGCDEFKNYNNLTDDTYTIFYQVFRVYDPTLPLVYILPIFMIIPAIWNVQKEIKSNYARNYLTRNNYRSYCKEMLKKVYKNCWILPVYCLIIFFVSYIFSGHFDYSFAVDHSIATYSLDKLNLGWLFIVGFVFNIFIHSLCYANLALICVKKNKSLILTIVETFIVWYGVVFVTEIFGGILVRLGLVKREVSLIFGLLNIYSLDNTPNMIYVIMFGLICFIISSVVLKIVYKNKEKSIICWES